MAQNKSRYPGTAGSKRIKSMKKTFVQAQKEMQHLSFDPQKDRNLTYSADVKKYFEHYQLNIDKRVEALTHCFGKFTAQGFDLACHYFAPAFPEATVYLLHGYLDHSGLFQKTIEFFVRNNYAVIIFDLPGHGLSSGKRFDIDNFNVYSLVLLDLLKLSQKQFPKTRYAIGQSTGGACILNLLVSQPNNPFSKIVLLAPLVRIKKWRWVKFSYPLLSRITKTVKRSYPVNSSDREFLQFIKHNDPLQPRRIPLHWLRAAEKWVAKIEKHRPALHSLLVIQGDRDTTVDWKHNVKVLEKLLPNMQSEIISGAGHQLANEGLKIRATIFSMIKKYIGKNNPYGISEE